MVTALIGISGSAQGAPPPNRPTITSLPPLVRQSKPSCAVLALPTRSITARIGSPAAFIICSSASASPPSTTASAPASAAAHRFQERQRHQPETAGAENHDRRVERLLHLLQRAVGGDAGTGIRRSGDGIEPLQVDQIFRMRHRHVIGIAAVAIDAERAWLDDAHVLITANAGLALAAA